MKPPKSRLSIGFLYDDTLDSSDGVAQYVKTLGAWFSSRGHRVSYLVGETKMSSYSGGKIYSLAKNKRVVFNGNRLSIPVLANRGDIEDILRSEHFDVLHVQVPYSPLMSQIVINKASKSVAIVGTFHIFPSSSWVEAGARLLRLLSTRSLKKFNQIVSVSRPAAEFANKTFSVHTEVVPNVVNVADLSGATVNTRRRDTYHVVFLGRLVKRKGCLPLLKAFAKLKAMIPDVRLTIAGDGPQRQILERYVKQQKLQDSVTFSGFVSEKDKPKLLASADIACFPSLYGESFGIVLIEAMAANSTVVLGGNNPGYASVLGAQKVLLIDPLKTEAFAARLKKLLTDKKLSLKLHKWQQAEVKKYDVVTIGPKIEHIYRRAIANKAKDRHN